MGPDPSFLNIRLFTVHQGEITKMHLALMGMVAEQYVSDLRDKVKRGQRGRALEGKVLVVSGMATPSEHLVNVLLTQSKQSSLTVSTPCTRMGSALV